MVNIRDDLNEMRQTTGAEIQEHYCYDFCILIVDLIDDAFDRYASYFVETELKENMP